MLSQRAAVPVASGLGIDGVGKGNIEPGLAHRIGADIHVARVRAGDCARLELFRNIGIFHSERLCGVWKFQAFPIPWGFTSNSWP